MILGAINQRNGMLPEKVLLTGISLSALFDTLQRIAIASGDPRANHRVEVVAGVRERYGVTLVPEPVQVGF